MKKIMKTILYLLIGSILCIVMLIWIKPSYLMNLINPIELESTTVLTKISKNDISADIKMGLESTTFMEFIMDSLTYEFYLDSAKINNGTIQVDKSFGKNEIDTLTIPFSIHMETLMSKLDSLAPTDSTQLRMRLKNYIKLPILGRKAFDINLEKKIPAPKLPKIKIVKIHDLSLKDKSIALDFEIENPSLYEATIVGFNSSIEFEELFSGKVRNNTELFLKPQGTTTFSATLDIDELEPLKDGLKMLFGGSKERSYTMDSQITVQLEDGSQLDLEMMNSGEMEMDLKNQ